MPFSDACRRFQDGLSAGVLRLLGVATVAAIMLAPGGEAADATAAGASPVYRVPEARLTFGGPTDFKVVAFEPAMGLPAASGKLTVAAWVRTGDARRPQIVLKREGAWQLGVGGWNQPRFFLAVWSPEIHTIMSEPVLASGEWQHLAGSYDGETFRLFLNGKLASAEAARYGTPVANGTQPLWIGANLPAGTPELVFSGDLADMALWDQALTAAEVAALAESPPPGGGPSVPGAPSQAPVAAAAPLPLEGTVNGVPVALELGAGIRLRRLGEAVAADAGRVFAVLVSSRRVGSDQVVVRGQEVVAAPEGWAIPFDLPENLGAGVLRLSPGSGPGVVDTRLELRNGGPPAVWRVLFPLVEGLALDRVPAGELEFFFPMQEGWLGRGECSLSVGYGTRGWLPVLAAWNPGGTGISLQLRDREAAVRSLLFRNTSGGGPSLAPPAELSGDSQRRLYGESYHPDGGRSAAAFPFTSAGLTLGVASLEFPLGIGQSWTSGTGAILIYEGRGLFKTPLASYGAWARATWWKHRPTPAWLRDSFLAFAVHERVGNRGFEKGFWDGQKWIFADQASRYVAEFGGHPFPEVSVWWKHGVEVTTGPFAGRLYPHTLGDYEFEPRFGGEAAFRAEIERVHQAGGRVCLYTQGRLVWKQSRVGRAHAADWAWMDTPGHPNLDWSGDGEGEWKTDYWNFCPQAKGWQEHLRDASRRILTVSGADAVRLDSEAEILLCYNPRHPHAADPLLGLLEYLATIRQGVEAAGTDKAMLSEFCGSDAAALYLDGTLAQGSDPDLPLADKMRGYGVSPFRFVYPEVKLIEWGNVPKAFDYLSRRCLFSAVGMTVGDVTPEQLRILTRQAEALRSVGDVIGSLDCEPLVPTLSPGVLANRFTLGDREAYTLWNRSDADAVGSPLSVTGREGRRFVDLLSGQEWRTRRQGPADLVEGTLPRGEVALIGVFPRLIEARGDGLFSGPATLTLDALDLQTGHTVASGVGELALPADASAGHALAVRALKDGYLVQDWVGVAAGK